MTIKYETALQMAQELGHKAYAREFEGEKGEALRRNALEDRQEVEIPRTEISRKHQVVRGDITQ